MIRRSTMMSVYGWLLFAPAAIFLIAFTYYPTMATLAKSFSPQGTARAQPEFVGLENSDGMLEDDVLAGGLEQLNLRQGHHPGVDRAGHSHGLWVNGKLSEIAGADGIFHANHSADDCRGQYLAISHAGYRVDRPDLAAVRISQSQLAR